MNSIGKLAELKACDYLQKKKYILLEANYRSRFGEIDLIMNKGKYICFIEVKMRNEKSIASPSKFVDIYKQRKMAATEVFCLFCFLFCFVLFVCLVWFGFCLFFRL